MDLEFALAQYDAAETNLERAEDAWRDMKGLIPVGITVTVGSPESRRYNELRRELEDLVQSLPAISGWRPDFDVPDIDQVAQDRLDAEDIGFLEAVVSVEKGLEAPGDVLAEYRYRVARARRGLVRPRVIELVGLIEAGVSSLAAHVPRDGTSVGDDEDWATLRDQITELERLAGNSIVRRGRWTELRRHLSFAQGVDVHDIRDHDWPSVRVDIESAIYGDREPVPLGVEDLSELTVEDAIGAATTALQWDRLSAEGFERLIFGLITSSPGYENPRWLTKTNAPDRGRDLSVDRVTVDALGGTFRHRVIIQCKHWRSTSVGVSHVNDAVAEMRLWEPPPVDVLVVATSGRFTSDAVAWIESRNHEGTRPRVEPWPESHLEFVLASRPALVSAHGLRGS